MMHRCGNALHPRFGFGAWLARVAIYLSMGTLSAVTPVAADFRSYGADISQSEWFLNGSALSCELIHPIPMFGTATFTTVAGKEQLLRFTLDSVRAPADEGSAELRSLPALWKPGVSGRPLGEVKVVADTTPVALPHKSAWQLLTELEQGRFPTFYFGNWSLRGSQVAASLSTVNFHGSYQQFLGCMAALLPFTFDDVAQTQVYFEFDAASFTPKTKVALERLRQYLRADSDLRKVRIEGYTDSKGSRWYNLQLGERRAEAVKSFLADAGISEDIIELVSYGEKKPARSNRSAEGRALNRRVRIVLVR